MPRSHPNQESFTGGEFSPLVQGRVKAERYAQGLAHCKNFIPVLQGPLVRRPGSIFVAEVKDSTKATRLVRFEFSTTQAYILEFGDQYIRFYRNGGQILETSAYNITAISQANPGVVTAVGHPFSNGDEVYITGVGGMTGVNGRNFKVANVSGNFFDLNTMTGVNFDTSGFGAYTSGGTATRVHTISSPYLEADLFNLTFVQSNDTLYIFHPSYPPRKITRTAHTVWSSSVISFVDGPYLPTNTSATTLTSSGASGSVTITASAATFASTDVGRHIRVFLNSTWSWLRITAFTSTTVVTATVVGPNIAAAATTIWRLGLWSDTTGYPATAVFHEDRLCPSGSTIAPQRIDMSKTGDYENFGPTALDASGTVTNSNACSFTLNSNDVNVLRWMVSSEKALMAGSVGGEWAVRPSTTGEAISPTNINARQVSTWGSANLQPALVGNAIIFIQRSTKRAREMSYYYYEDSFRSPDRTKLAEHIAGTGFKQLAVQKHPHSIMWAVRNDGVVAAMTYEKEDENIIVAWHRHVFGGASDASGTASIAESVACIPSSDGKRDEVWFVVKRYIGGRTVRYVEYLSPFFDDSIEQKDAFFVDCGLTYDAPKTITAGTLANPAVITSALHGFSNGDIVVITEVVGFEVDDVSMVNGQIFTVRNVAANTFQLEDMDGNTIDSSTWSAYVSGGEVRKFVTSITPLWHLEGQSVQVLADGAVMAPVTVTNGTISLPTHAAVAQIGLAMESEAQQLRQESGSAVGSSIGATRRAHKVVFDLYRSLGLMVGVDFDNMDTVTFRQTSTAYGAAVPLFSGLLEVDVPSGYDTENQIAVKTTDPLPLMLRAITVKMNTEDAL